MKTSTFWISLMCMTVFLVSVPEKVLGENEFEITPSADIVSNYVWRGTYQTGASLQPELSFSYSGFLLTAWGSTDFSVASDEARSKEFDITLGYLYKGFSIAVTDYWWSGQGARYGRYSSDHFFEGAIGWNFGASFPLSLTWNTMFAGGDKDEKNDRNYSTYIEASYEFSIQGINITPAFAVSPWSGLYGKDFSVPSVSLTASKDIKITDSFSLPLFTQVIVSPEHDDVFLIVGVSF